ncbi:MAG: tRNA pseudouridine(13) synthase TruD [Planctomyces sp.]|nr:tRNA pseudouridine(13) synthase TruD [Planctomyces sp.]
MSRRGAPVKLRRLPEDFGVEELADFPIGESGAFAAYRLRKQSLGTLEAVDAIQRRWGIERRRMSWGGLKDKHAVTVQHLTILNGPRRDLSQSHLELEYLGQSDRAFTAADIRANRFSIVIRSLTEAETQTALAALQSIPGDGIPNYFDDQRFGSLTASGEFIARPWIAGDYERTLWLALAEAHPFDRTEEKEQKRLLREHWGRWTECKAALDRSHRRSVVTFLADRPGDFRGAWARLKVDLRSLYLAAFQSWLWNRMAATFLRETCPADILFDVPLKGGAVPFFQALPDDCRRPLQTTSLPLPSARLKLEPGPTLELATRVLAAENLELRQIRVKYPRDSFFSKGWRKVVAPVQGLEHRLDDDELDAGRRRLSLAFTLPRGSYATILVKRITAMGAGAAPFLDEAPGEDDLE